MIAPPPVLSFQGVQKAYPSPRGLIPVLNDVNLTIHQGDFLVLTGHSGSGKTTLLNLASMLDRPTGGRILFQGQDISDLEEDALADIRKRELGMIFQSFCLLPNRTALENVVFRYRYLDNVDPKESHERAMASLDILGLSHVAHQPTRLLSGGEMQRVAIARAVAQRPIILMADEPTGNLDAGSTRVVMESLAQLNNEGITILLVTHNMELLEYTTRHVICHEGNIKESTAT